MPVTSCDPFLRRLLRDSAGNTMAMIAAAVVPLLAMIGGGIDMGRSYMSQSRLQQACDAGVLAARKKLGSQIVVGGIIPDGVEQAGNRFFSANFQAGAYGTVDRDFKMVLEEDNSITGAAKADVRTSVMSIFGYAKVHLNVACRAKLNFSNTDIMFVLDTTGSMAETNPGDSGSRMDMLKSVVKAFHAQIESAKSADTRVRYGFVPYSTNVNVGGLLKNEWVAGKWAYQSREQAVTGHELSTITYDANWKDAGGTKSENMVRSTYAPTYHKTSGNSGSTTVDANENVVIIPASEGGGYYSCDTPAPAGNATWNDVLISAEDQAYLGPPAGVRHIEHRKATVNGSNFWISFDGTTCSVVESSYNNYSITYDRITDPIERELKEYRYKQISRDVPNWRVETNGCIEERATYQISDYSNVDMRRALDLDLDTVPTKDIDTQWKPMYPDIVYARSMKYDGTGTFTPKPQNTTDEYVKPLAIGLAACPAPSHKLAEMTGEDINGVLNSLYPTGQTYHDIGMIWGGRLISPTGLFAAENADVPGKPTSRHLIFLTDGETAPLDLAYSSYGVEPLDQRRWQPSNSDTLTQTVEKRFGVACEEVRKRNVTIWVISFGTTLNPVLTQCAGADHAFEAQDAAQLSAIFGRIASSIGDLRIAQ